jgi:hypothetical protein
MILAPFFWRQIRFGAKIRRQIDFGAQKLGDFA